MEVEHGTFTPLVFGTNGAMGEECAKFHKLLAAKLEQKNRKRYSTVMQWLRTRLSFSILRSALLCLRGTRVPFHRPVSIDTDFIYFFFFITTFSLFLIWDNFNISSLHCILNCNF